MRIVVIVILFFCFSLPQYVKAQEFGGGVSAGTVASQVFGDPSSGYNKLGFYAGVFVNRQFTLKSGAQMELYFIQKGARENPTEENAYSQYLLRINMIELPVLYHYHINKNLLLSAGLAYTLIIGNPYEESNFSTSVPDTPWNNNSITFILGIEYRISASWSAVFRTNNSITAIRDHASGEKRLFNTGQYSDALSLGLSYHLFKPNTN